MLFSTILDILATTAVAKTITPNAYAGTYNLTALVVTFSNKSQTQPLGEAPYGRLVLTPGLFFISEFNSGNYSSQSFSPPPQLYVPGSAVNNAAVVRNSLSISGTYEIDEQGAYTGLTTTGSTIPNFIGSTVHPPNSTFTLMEGGRELIETLALGNGSVVEYHWGRVEVL